MQPFDQAWLLLKQKCGKIQSNPLTQLAYECKLPAGHDGRCQFDYENPVEMPDIPENNLTHNPFDVDSPPPPKEDSTDFDFNDY